MFLAAAGIFRMKGPIKGRLGIMEWCYRASSIRVFVGFLGVEGSHRL